LSRPHVDDRAVKDAAQGAEHLVAVRHLRPLHGKHAERHRRDDRVQRLPPHLQRLVVKKTREHRRRFGVDEQALLEPAGRILW